MAESYWRSVHRRAFKDTLSALQIESVERAVVAAIAAIVGVAVIWLVGDASDTRGELLARLGATTAVLAIFPALYFWRFLKTPALLDAEKKEKITDLEATVERAAQSAELQSAHTDAIRAQTEELRAQRMSRSGPALGYVFGRKHCDYTVTTNNPMHYLDVTIDKKFDETTIKISGVLFWEGTFGAKFLIGRRNDAQIEPLAEYDIYEQKGSLPFLVTEKHSSGNIVYEIRYATNGGKDAYLTLKDESWIEVEEVRR